MLSPSLFESVFNSSAIGNYLLSPTPEATILAVNDTFLKASSRKREELVGVSLFEAFPGNPDDQKDTGETALRRSLARVVETGEPDSLPAQRYPIRVELPNGDVTYEERFWSAVNTPIFGEDGRIVCISHTTTDVTEQVRSAAALRESEKRFRALTNATADVVYRMSPDWTQLYELEGRGFIKDTARSSELWLHEYVPPEDQDLVHRAIANAVREKSVYELEHRVLQMDGGFGWAYSRAVPMLDANGEIYEWIGAASDITERKLAEEKLKVADRRKDEFLAMLAHELRNPLAPIAAAADLLGLIHLNEEKVRQTSAIISRQVRHMTGLVDDLLDVSRVTRGLVELEKSRVDVKKVIADSVEQVRPLIESRGHTLSVHTPPQPAFVTGDQKRLVQVLTNLLNNAAKYTPEGGTIVLSMEVEGGHVKTAVTDNGIGMTRELADRAFELFAQAERSSDRSQGGLGIGLALVKSLVDLHGGTVAVKSEGLGKGSRFIVCLPALTAQADRAEGGGHPVINSLPLKRLKVMVVDDNVDVAQMLSMLVEATGHQALVEYSPEKALRRAQVEKPSVCLLDIGLPEMDGKELARRLRAQPETSNSLLVAVTGYGREEDRKDALAAGFDYHLVKPVDIKKVGSIFAEAERRQ